MKKTNKKGFTLVELLVVMAIIGILSTLGLVSFRNAQPKSRDSRRKSDLEQVQRALEMYYNDYNDYPSSNGGAIQIGSTLTWGVSEMKDSKGTIYMKELPKDPTGNPEYCYVYINKSFKLYARLENTNDPVVGGPYSCGGVSIYNYGVASPNEKP